MARGVNKVILIGNLGADPEVRYMPSGGAVTTVTIATSESWKDKETGQLQDKTEWHRVVFFNRTAEVAGEYLRKGSKVYVEGSLRTRKWQDKTGIERYTTEIVSSTLQMLDSKNAGAAGGYEGGAAPAARQSSQQNNSPATADEFGQGMPAGINDFDDEIPF